MRLWHPDLIPHLPRQQLLGQHRECCAMRGLGWGRKHSVVNYVWEHPRSWLVRYHLSIMDEMECDRRKYKPNPVWRDPCYRGKQAPRDKCVDMDTAQDYTEHDVYYLLDCLENLREKGINLYGKVTGALLARGIQNGTVGSVVTSKGTFTARKE